MSTPGPSPKVSDGELLRGVKLHPDPAVTASEMADQFPYGSANLTKRFNNLADRGLLGTKSVGGGARVYWTTDEGAQYIANEFQASAGQ